MSNESKKVKIVTCNKITAKTVKGYSASYLSEREVPITKNARRARRRETEAIEKKR